MHGYSLLIRRLSSVFAFFKSKSSSSEEKEAAPETGCEPEKTSEYVHILPVES